MTQIYRVIKLRSGEELIAEVAGSENGNIKLLKPMVFKSIIIPDSTGIPKEGIVLKNWLAFGNQNETTIPEDFIATTLEPTQDVMTYYLAEKDREPGSYHKTPVEDIVKQQEKSQPKSPDEYEDMIAEMFQSIFGEMEKEEEPKKKKKKKQNKEEIIHMSLVFSPQALAYMINEGLIDPRDIMDMINHFGLNEQKKSKKKNRESINDHKFTGEQKERKDFGNKWTDWNPDPKSDDYK